MPFPKVRLFPVYALSIPLGSAGHFVNDYLYSMAVLDLLTSDCSRSRLQTTIEDIQHLASFVQTVDDSRLPITYDAVTINVAFRALGMRTICPKCRLTVKTDVSILPKDIEFNSLSAQ